MTTITAATLATGVILLASCSDSGTDTGSDAAVRFNAATSASTGVAAALVGTPDTVTDGTNTLVIDTAQMVLRDIKFHMAETAICSDSRFHRRRRQRPSRRVR